LTTKNPGTSTETIASWLHWLGSLCFIQETWRSSLLTLFIQFSSDNSDLTRTCTPEECISDCNIDSSMSIYIVSHAGYVFKT
jgi:hypothetical protein